MIWRIVLDNGDAYLVHADNLLDISLKLQDEGMITSDYDIIAVVRVDS